MSTLSDRGWRKAVPDVLLTNNKVVFLESLVVLVVVWSVLTRGLGITNTVPTPTMVAVETVELLLSGDWIEHMQATLRRVLYGFVITVVVGTVLGMLMGLSEFWEDALADYVTISLALPSLFAAVFAAMWFGVSDVTPMIASLLIAFPYIAQNVYEATENIDQSLFEMSASFDVSRRRVLRRVVFSSILPAWFGGVRYSFTIAWKITTLAELVAAQNGIGYVIGIQMRTLSMVGILAWTILFTAVMLVVEYGVFQQAEKRVFSWRQGEMIGLA